MLVKMRKRANRINVLPFIKSDFKLPAIKEVSAHKRTNKKARTKFFAYVVQNLKQLSSISRNKLIGCHANPNLHSNCILLAFHEV